MPQNELRQITIKVDSKGSPEIEAMAKQLGGLTKTAKSLSDGMSFLKNAFVGYFSALQIGSIVEMSDSMQQLNDRLKLFAKPGENSRDILEEISNRASRTKTSVDALAETYVRLASTTKSSGLTTKQLLDLTETLQNTFRISGSNTQEAANAAVQLSQAFSLGTLRGQDFKSVIQQNTYLADLLAKSLDGVGGDKGKLQKMAENGEILASKVLKAIFDNMEEVDRKAATLSQTFGQTLTVAMNDVKIAILDLNENFKLSDKFADSVEKAKKYTKTLIDILKEYIGVASSISAGDSSPFIKFFSSLSGLPIVSTLIDMVTYSDKLASSITYLSDKFLGFLQVVNSVYAALVTMPVVLGDIQEKITGKNTLKEWADGVYKSIEKLNEKLESLKSTSAQLYENSPLDPLGPPRRTPPDLVDGKKQEKLKEILGKINKEYLAGKINAEQYYRQLEDFEDLKIDEQFKEGKYALDKYNLALEESSRRNITRDFNNGRISLEEFNKQIEKSKVQDLNTKLDAGTISLRQFEEELTKISEKLGPGGVIRTGTQSYLNSIGTTASQITSAISGAFSHLEDNLVEFTKTGLFNFNKFTQAILDDITRIIIRASIVKPLAEGILSVASAPSADTYSATRTSSSVSQPFATGGVFHGGLKKFAAGDVVSSPTMFSYGNGKTGLMGEAGPEAILPLKRGSGGNLGVQASVTPVTVNIINQSGADIQQRESTGPGGERLIEILIQKKVNDGILNGSFDKSFRQSYNLQRKGS